MFAVAKIVSGGDMLVHSAEAVREAYTETDQIKSDLREAINRGENPVIDISASFDGTCQKRGFTSLYGVSISTDVLTGYIVDYVVLSKYCHACKIQEESAWSRAGGMERRVRCRLLPEPPSVHGAGGSKDHVATLSGKVRFLLCGDVEWCRLCCIQSCDTAPYGETVINKLECVNHAHKHMGTALRKLAKEERLGRRGVGRLTENKCDSLQNFYQGTILNNIPNIDKMRSAVWASHHATSTDASPQHQQCPEGVDSRRH